MSLGLLLFALACQENKKPAASTFVRGHSLLKEGVAHGLGLLHAERYCSSCHGDGLVGGAAFEPSCYSCHGKNWRDEVDALSFAPDNHTADHGQFLHDPAASNATAVCSECHGGALQGDFDRGTPGCYLCHDVLWTP